MSKKEEIIFNNSFIEFNDEETGEQQLMQDSYVHIRSQQRNGKKSITIIQNMPDEYDLNKLVKALRKTYACNGSLTTHNIYGEIIMLQGDKRTEVYEFITKVGLVKPELVKIH
jgi:translation initiation factor 1